MSDVRVVAKFVPADEQRGKLAHWAYWFEWEEADGTPARQRYPAEVPLDVAEAIIADGSSALRARVAELEPQAAALESCQRARRAAEERVAELEGECSQISEEFGLPPTIRPAEGEIRRFMAELKESRARASAAVEAHAALLSRIAADGTLDAMERAKRMGVELAGVCGAAESLLSPDSSAVDIERLRVRVMEARAALAASESEAPSRCRCGHDASQHYGDSEARGSPCRECVCLGMDSDEAPAREGKP